MGKESVIKNRDPGDETYEECGETIYTYVTDGDTYPACRMPKGHIGKHTTWYFHPEGGWGRKTTPRITNELLKDKDEK